MIKKFKDLPTSKKFLWFLFLNCFIVEFFTLVITFIMVIQAYDTLTTPDLTCLNTLIGCFCAEAVGYGIYSLKAAKENSVGGIVHDMAIGGEKEIETEPEVFDEEAEG